MAGVLDFAVGRIEAGLWPRYPNVDDVAGLQHTYGCGVAPDAPVAPVAPVAIIPIRT